MRKSLNKSPRAQAKENDKIRKLGMKYELDEFTQNIASFSRDTIAYDSDDGGMDDDMSERRYTTREAWEKYTIKELVDLYVASLAKGKPSLALTDPQQKAHICTCTDKRTKSVTLYMMCAHVERSLVYSSGGKTPNAAIHFALLNYLHITKMIVQTATHGFAQIANIINDEDKPLQKDVLNSVYLLYRRIINHSTDLMTEKFDLQTPNCYSCDGATNKFITMDGNFQLSRKPTAKERLDVPVLPPFVTSFLFLVRLFFGVVMMKRRNMIGTL